MKNKLIFKIIFMSIFIVFTICILNNIAFGTNNFDFNAYENSENSTLIDPINNIIGTTVEVIRIIGTGISIIIIISIGIKYMIASPGERADVKKSSIQYTIGAIIVFGSVNILQIIIDVISAV